MSKATINSDPNRWRTLASSTRPAASAKGFRFAGGESVARATCISKTPPEPGLSRNCSQNRRQGPIVRPFSSSNYPGLLEIKVRPFSVHGLAVKNGRYGARRCHVSKDDDSYTT